MQVGNLENEVIVDSTATGDANGVMDDEIT